MHAKIYPGFSGANFGRAPPPPVHEKPILAIAKLAQFCACQIWHGANPVSSAKAHSPRRENLPVLRRQFWFGENRPGFGSGQIWLAAIFRGFKDGAEGVAAFGSISPFSRMPPRRTGPNATPTPWESVERRRDVARQAMTIYPGSPPRSNRRSLRPTRSTATRTNEQKSLPPPLSPVDPSPKRPRCTLSQSNPPT